MEKKTVIRTERAPAPFRGAPYSQAIRVGDMIYVSGQLPGDPSTGKVVGTSVREQTGFVMFHIRTILEEAGSGMDKLVKTSVFIRTFSEFKEMNEEYARHVGDVPPARSTIAVGEFPEGVMVEIDAIAHV